MNVFYKYGVLASSGGEPSPQWTVQYNANELPNLATPAWTSGVNNGSASITNGILNVTTTGTEQMNYKNSIGNITASPTKRLLTRVRVNTAVGSASAPAQAIEIGDGVRLGRIYLDTDRLWYLNSSLNTIQLGLVDMQTDFVLLRMDYNDTNGLSVYVNDVQIGSTIPYTSFFANSSNAIFFGDNSSADPDFSSNVDYDYIYYQLDLESNPDV